MRVAILIALFLTSMLLASCANPVVLDERFLDNRLENWTIIDDPQTVEIPSDWRVEDDAWLHQRSNIWGRRGDFLGRWYGTMAIAGGADWANYRLSVKARPGDDDGFGVIFRFTDSEHFYRLLFLNDGLSGGPLTRLDKRDGEDYTEIWSSPQGYREGKEAFIEVEADGDRLRVRVDDKLLFEVQDTTYKRGKVGLFCYAQKEQAFDNVRVVLL